MGKFAGKPYKWVVKNHSFLLSFPSIHPLNYILLDCTRAKELILTLRELPGHADGEVFRVPLRLQSMLGSDSEEPGRGKMQDDTK